MLNCNLQWVVAHSDYLLMGRRTIRSCCAGVAGMAHGVIITGLLSAHALHSSSTSLKTACWSETFRRSNFVTEMAVLGPTAQQVKQHLQTGTLHSSTCDHHTSSSCCTCPGAAKLSCHALHMPRT